MSRIKVNIKVLRWILLTLYLATLVGLFGISCAGKTLPDWLSVFTLLENQPFWTIFTLGTTLFSQGFFIIAVGEKNLCRPIRRPRLLFPLIVASFMMGVLVAVLFASLIELLDFQAGDWFGYVFYTVMGLSWVIWGFVFFVKYKDLEGFTLLKKLVTIIISGSLIELLAAIPSHLIVMRRPGCFVGMFTACGIFGGVAVMLWAFGPGILLLFLAEKRKSELKRKIIIK